VLLLAAAGAGCAKRRAVLLPTVRAPLYDVRGIKRVGLAVPEAPAPVPGYILDGVLGELEKGFRAAGRVEVVRLTSTQPRMDVDAIVFSRVWYGGRVSPHQRVWIDLVSNREQVARKAFREVTAELATEFTMVERARPGSDLPCDRIVATVTDTARYSDKLEGARGPVDGPKIARTHLLPGCAYRFLRTVSYSKVEAIVMAKMSSDLHEFFKKRKYADALAYVEENYPDRETNARHAFLYGLCCDALGQYREADRYYEIAYADDPEDPDCAAAVARIDAILGGRR
jgi:hypothetical protein